VEVPILHALKGVVKNMALGQVLKMAKIKVIALVKKSVKRTVTKSLEIA
jgi:hypothetical protein